MTGAAGGPKARQRRRPAGEDSTGAATRERLLFAARRVFAQRGFAGASVREITAAAGVNLGAVTYHFGSKQALYEAVLAEAFRPLQERIAAEAGSADGSVLDLLDARLRIVFEHLQANPDLQFLVLQQIGQHELPAPAARAFSGIFGGLSTLIAEAQRRGEVRAGDPMLMAISAVSQPAYLGMVARFLLHRLPLPGGAPSWEEIAEHGVAFARAGLAAVPSRAGGRKNAGRARAASRGTGG